MAKNTTEGLYQAVIDNVASLLAAVKGEAKANKRLGNSVARLRWARRKPLPGFQSSMSRSQRAAKDETRANQESRSQARHRQER